MAFSSQDYTVDGNVDKIVNWKDKYNALVAVVGSIAGDDTSLQSTVTTLQSEIDNIGVYNDFLTAYNAAKA
jgi:hypothetical protein